MFHLLFNICVVLQLHFMIAETWCGACLQCPQNKINFFSADFFKNYDIFSSSIHRTQKIKGRVMTVVMPANQRSAWSTKLLSRRIYVSTLRWGFQSRFDNIKQATYCYSVVATIVFLCTSTLFSPSTMHRLWHFYYVYSHDLTTQNMILNVPFSILCVLGINCGCINRGTVKQDILMTLFALLK